MTKNYACCFLFYNLLFILLTKTNNVVLFINNPVYVFNAYNPFSSKFKSVLSILTCRFCIYLIEQIFIDLMRSFVSTNEKQEEEHKTPT